MGLFDFFKSTPDPDIPVVKNGIVRFKGTEFPLDWDETDLPDDSNTLEAMSIFFAGTSWTKDGEKFKDVFPAKYKKYKDNGKVCSCIYKLAFLYYPLKDQHLEWAGIYLSTAEKLLLEASIKDSSISISGASSEEFRNRAIQFAVRGMSLSWQDEFAAVDCFMWRSSFGYGYTIKRMDHDVLSDFPEPEKHLAEMMDAVVELVKEEKRRKSGIVPGYYFAQELVSLKKMGIDRNGMRFYDSLQKGAEAGNPYCMGYVGARGDFDSEKIENAAHAGDYISTLWMARFGPGEKRDQMRKKCNEMECVAHEWLDSVPEDQLRDRLMDELLQIDRDRIECETLYADGLHLIQSENEAERARGVEMLKKAAAMDDARAQGQLTLFRAKQGDAEAQLQAGEFYLEGRNGLEKNHAAAVEMFRKAADQNNGKACTRLAECYLNGWGVEQNGVTAMRLLRVAAQYSSVADAGDTARLLARQGDVESAKALYEKALSVEVTDKASAEQLRRNCQGYVDLLVSRDGKLNKNVHEAFLAALDYLAMSPLVNEAEDFKEYLLLAAQGDILSIKRLSSAYRYYYNSRRQNIQVYNNVILMALHMELLRLYTLKAEQGDIDACYRLWLEYSVYPPAIKEGNKWGWKAIEANYPPMLYGAYVEADSLGISRYQKMDYLYKAAELGNQSAIAELELMEMEAEAAERRASERRRAAEAEAKKARQAKLDWAERDFDLMTGGTGYTMEEKALRGEISTEDYILHKNFRDMMERKNS